VKEMQERWNKLMVVFLGALHSEFSKARPNVIGSSTANYNFLREVVPSESQNPAIMETQYRSTLEVQPQQQEVRGRGCGKDHSGGCSGG